MLFGSFFGKIAVHVLPIPLHKGILGPVYQRKDTSAGAK